MHKHYLTIALPIITAYLTGCMPSVTKTQGTINIRPSGNKQVMSSIPSKETERYVVVSLWASSLKEKYIINKVILTEEETVTIKFPMKAYLVAWTPVLGVQHFNPEPGIIVFHKDYLPSWNVGGTDTDKRICCDKPRSKHNFSIELVGSEQAWLDKKDEYSDKWFLEEFLTERKNLLKKMKKCKGLTEQEIEMVLDKLSQAARILGVEDSG